METFTFFHCLTWKHGRWRRFAAAGLIASRVSDVSRTLTKRWNQTRSMELTSVGQCLIKGISRWPWKVGDQYSAGVHSLLLLLLLQRGLALVRVHPYLICVILFTPTHISNIRSESSLPPAPSSGSVLLPVAISINIISTFASLRFITLWKPLVNIDSEWLT